jgi:hypothetical protein
MIMKKTLITIGLCLLFGVGARAQTNAPLFLTPPVSVLKIEWRYLTAELTNKSFQVYTSPRLDVPLTNWQFVVTVPATNVYSVTNEFSYFRPTVAVYYGSQFWAVKVVDTFWGDQLFFEERAWTNAFPRTDSPIAIFK